MPYHLKCPKGHTFQSYNRASTCPTCEQAHRMRDENQPPTTDHLAMCQLVSPGVSETSAFSLGSSGSESSSSGFSSGGGGDFGGGGSSEEY